MKLIVHAWGGLLALAQRLRGRSALSPVSVCPYVIADNETTQQRLTRLALWCTTDRLAEAELELHGWQREESCPAAARLLLAALLARRGRRDQARAILHHSSTQNGENDPALGQLLVTLLVADEMPEAARRAARQLFHQHGQSPALRLWLEAMQPTGRNELPQVPDAAVEHLALDLLRQPELLVSLVAAQRLQPEPTHIRLLRLACLRAYQDIHDARVNLLFCQALADLALFAQDADDARRWAHRGLKIDPYAAALALVLAQIDDDPAVGPPAVQVLTQVARANPDYPDVLAALVRREQAEGHRDQARLHLSTWLDRHPQHPLANHLEKELAA